MSQKTIFSNNVCGELDQLLKVCNYNKVFLLTDENTHIHCTKLLAGSESLTEAEGIEIKASDKNKTIDSVVHVWKELSDKGATRNSCLVTVGGGMATDLGGFAASTFKRGIDFINIPTTLLAMVDASVGGKTGFNFNGLKNEIGVFNEAKAVIVDTDFLKTLDSENIASGYAEMLKHSLISDEKMWAQHICFDLNNPDYTLLLDMIERNVGVKERIVTEDPHEKGIRKALNFGHTFGHAFESFALSSGRPILHGYAVAYGIICELYLSTVILGFPTDKLHQTVRFIKENYGQFYITCNDYDRLIELMQHDKKNSGTEINFTLLGNIGDIHINENASKELINEAFDFYREA